MMAESTTSTLPEPDNTWAIRKMREAMARLDPPPEHVLADPYGE